MSRWNERRDYGKEPRRRTGKRYEWEKRGDKYEGFKKKPRRQQEERRASSLKAEPQPINGKCSPLCPLFVCTKRAYKLRFDKATGRRYVYCTWIGDECIGASCQYAACRMNYLMPDGTCGWVKQQRMEKQTSHDEFEDRFEESLQRKARSLLGKKYGKLSLDDYL